MAKGDGPEFEQPNVDKLRKAYYRPSMWSRIGGFLAGVATSRTTWTVVLGVLILAALAFGYGALS